MKKNFPYSIEWTKDRYTIPEAISILVKEGDLSEYGDKSKPKYKKLYQALRRDLDEEVDELDREGSPRKQTFSRDAIIKVVNDRADWLRRLNEEKVKLTDWAARAKDYQRALRKYLKTYSPEEYVDQVFADDGGCQEYVNDRIMRIRADIIFDFILRYCIDFDQACLEHDLSLEYTFDELNPTPEAMEAVSRLEDIHSYYDAKPEFVALLETIRSLQEKAGKKQ